MTLHLPTLLFVSVALLALSAGIMTLAGATRHVYRGYWWWTAALWLLAAGLALHAVRDAYPAVLPVANLLTLQWPILILAGMRRFYSRQTLSLPPGADWLLLALAYLLWLASWAAPGDVTSRVATYTLGALALHVYAAWMIARLAKFNASAALKALVAIQLLAAGVQAYGLAHVGWGVTPGAGRDAWILAGSQGTALAALAMVFVALLLTFERTEANLRAAQQKLRFLADMDVLTEVPNRRHFHELATRALASSVGSGSTVMMFDIDHFKQVNDLLGHATGDEALRQVAHCIRETLRGQDVAGRMGGDEFAVLLPHTDVDDAMAVAERIASRLEDRQVAPRIARISLSFGVVQMRSNENVVEALRRADHALYEAKRQGRSRAVVAVGAEDHLLFGESRSLGLPGF